MASMVRVGIDVGGTFTHAVAIDNYSLEIVAHQVVPTTHSAAEGVAKGIIQAYGGLVAQLPSDHRVVFLAHSTTQATNALLEGDVDQVGIIGLAAGLEAVKAKGDLTVGDVELSSGKYLRSQLVLIDAGQVMLSQAVGQAVEQLHQSGCGAIVAAQGFSVDDASGELTIVEQARQRAIPACATHEMSGLYGLKVRTRTAVLNASILPKMINTALMTEQALGGSDKQIPLMVMRSDGGVMSLNEVKRRPVMTLLSGPAAGIAAALMFLKASDAIFLEVGGTSSDICLIKDGRAALRSATIGGHPTYLRTLDSRTIGIAGGSMVSWPSGSRLKAGPRSAHLAGYKYCSFAELGALDGGLSVLEVTPLAGDPPYLVVRNRQGQEFAITCTCAANLLGYIKPGDYSYGNQEAVMAGFTAVAQYLGEQRQISMDAEQLARMVLDSAVEQVIPTIEKLISDYKVQGRSIKLLGGGGGAGAIVPYLAERLQASFEVAQNAEVISAIGAALAMVRECIERTISNPSQADLSSIRADAERAVVAMGADPATIEVTVEVDAQRSIVRAIAVGSVEFSADKVLAKDVSDPERLAQLQEACPNYQDWQLLGHTSAYYIYSSQQEHKVLFGLFKKRKQTLWVTDACGSVRLQIPGGQMRQGKGGGVEPNLSAVLQEFTSYGDAGALIPALHVVAGRKLTDFTSLASAEQVMALAREEMANVSSDEPVFYLVHQQV